MVVVIVAVVVIVTVVATVVTLISEVEVVPVLVDAVPIKYSILQLMSLKIFGNTKYCTHVKMTIESV
jgi:hypothetical protein